MNKQSIVNLTGFLIILVVFVLTFFIYFRETHEFFSSLTASSLSSILVLGVVVVVGWFVRAFTKS